MLSRRLLPIACLISFAVVAPLQVRAADAVYVQAETLPPQLLPPPPAEGSKAWRKQIAEVVHAQRAAPYADRAAMKDEQRLRLDVMTSILGDSFTRDRLPKTFAMLDEVMRSVGQVTETDKQFWHTRRPYLTDPHVKLLVDPIDNSPSYPSGHTSESLVLAEVLGMLASDKLPDLRARADAIAHHRIEAGVHYPGDIEGGRRLAMLITGSLIANDDFQDDLAAARKEIADKSAS